MRVIRSVLLLSIVHKHKKSNRGKNQVTTFPLGWKVWKRADADRSHIEGAVPKRFCFSASGSLFLMKQELFLYLSCLYLFNCHHYEHIVGPSVMFAWEKYIYLNINMQLAFVQLWNPYSIQYNLRDEYLMQQLIWTDIKAIMYYNFRTTRYEHDYILWSIELDARRNANWLSWNIHSQNIWWNKTGHAHNQYDGTES